MVLEVKLDEDHIVVTDGCLVAPSVATNIVSAKMAGCDITKEIKFCDENRRLSQSRQEICSLMRLDVGVARVFASGDTEMTVSCPTCRTEYRITKEYFQKGVDMYQEQTRTPQTL